MHFAPDEDKPDPVSIWQDEEMCKMILVLITSNTQNIVRITGTSLEILSGSFLMKSVVESLCNAGRPMPQTDERLILLPGFFWMGWKHPLFILKFRGKKTRSQSPHQSCYATPTGRSTHFLKEIRPCSFLNRTISESSIKKTAWKNQLLEPHGKPDCTEL